MKAVRQMLGFVKSRQCVCKEGKAEGSCQQGKGLGSIYTEGDGNAGPRSQPPARGWLHKWPREWADKLTCDKSEPVEIHSELSGPLK